MIVDGELEITPVTDKVTVTVVEKSDNVTYDAAEHSITGYESMTADNALYDIANVAKTPTAAWTAKGTYVGTYHVGIKAADFKNTSGNFTNVEFVIADGDLVITPASVAVVKIEGHTKTVTYNGKEQTVEGYTITSNPANATVTLVGEAVASGTDAKHFSPDAACTRAQAVTFLWRAAGSPAGYANSGYTDVPETSYCAAPVAWAVALRITSGTGTLTFSPDDLCTRAQIVTFLYRANA